MYLTLPNIEPFWLCFNIRSTIIQCQQLVYRPIFSLNIPIPCYIYIKEVSLLVIFFGGGGGGGGYLRIIPCLFYILTRLNNSLLTRFMRTHVFFCRQCCRTFLCFSWSLVDVLTRVVLIGNYRKVSAIKCLT